MEKGKEELSKEQRIELEEKAIETLLQYGAKFSVPLKISPRNEPKRITWWNKHFPQFRINWVDKRINKRWIIKRESISDIMTGFDSEVYMRYFRIRPLYLGTIDMLRKLELQIEFNEDDIQKNPTSESEKLFKYNNLMAKIVAIAVLNCSDISDPLNDEVSDLQDFFYTHLTSARLHRLCMIIDQLKNRGSFTNSIRLMLQAEATTAPKADRIE